MRSSGGSSPWVRARHDDGTSKPATASRSKSFCRAVSASCANPAGRRSVRRPTLAPKNPSCVMAQRLSMCPPDCGAGSARFSTFTRARSEAARALGAIPVAADRADVVASVREITNGEMADVIVDLAPGAPDTVETALALARKAATIILAASKRGKPVTGSLNDIVVRKELTVKGVRGRDYQSVEEALRLIASRRYPLERIRTHEFQLEQADQALRVQGERTDPSAIHVTVVP